MRTMLRFCWIVAVLLQWGVADAACPAVTRVGISDRGYLSFRTANGYDGIIVGLLNEIGRRTGCKIEFVWLPTSRIMVDMATTQVDINPISLRTSERDAYADFLPYAYSRFSLVISKRVDGHFKNLTEFRLKSNARLNMVRGLNLGPEINKELDLLEQQGRLERVNNFDTLFKKISVGRADAVLGSSEVLLRSVRLDGLESAVTFVPVTKHVLVGMYLSSKTLSDDTIRHYALALRSAIEDGTVVALYERYLSPALVSDLFQPGTIDIAAALQARAISAPANRP